MRQLALIVFLLTIIGLMSAPVFATTAGSCVFSADPIDAFDPFTHSAVIGVQVQWACTANSSGAITTPTITDSSGNPYTVPPMSGRISRVQIVSGAGLSAGAVTLYSGSDTTDDILGGLGGTISTTSGNTKTDVPLTPTGKMLRELQKEVPTVSGTGLGSGGVFTLKVLLRW